jgi:hypothetical protein
METSVSRGIHLTASMLRFLLVLAASACGIVQGQRAPLFYWPLDETSGTVVHPVTNGTNGIVQGNTEWLPDGGHHAGALRFNGNTARADLGPCDITTGATETFSIACWFKPEIISGTERILMAKAVSSEVFVWSISLVNNTGARVRIKAGGSMHIADIPPSTLFNNTWYHLAATYDGSMVRVYLNGSLTAFTGAAGVVAYDADAPVTLGNIHGNAMPYYGNIDDVRIYDVALTQAEVVDLVIGNVNTGIAAPEAQSIPATQDHRFVDLSGREVPFSPAGRSPISIHVRTTPGAHARKVLVL